MLLGGCLQYKALLQVADGAVLWGRLLQVVCAKCNNKAARLLVMSGFCPGLLHLPRKSAIWGAGNGAQRRKGDSNADRDCSKPGDTCHALSGKYIPTCHRALSSHVGYAFAGAQ